MSKTNKKRLNEYDDYNFYRHDRSDSPKRRNTRNSRSHSHSDESNSTSSSRIDDSIGHLLAVRGDSINGRCKLLFIRCQLSVRYKNKTFLIKPF